MRSAPNLIQCRCDIKMSVGQHEKYVTCEVCCSYCIVQAFAVGDKNTGKSLEELIIILHQKNHCRSSVPTSSVSNGDVLGRSTHCMQIASDNSLDFLALPA